MPRWTRQAWRVSVAFFYGVLLGIAWECASMLVLLAATLVEHVAGTFVMMATFVGLAAAAYSIAARAGMLPAAWLPPTLKGACTNAPPTCARQTWHVHCSGSWPSAFRRSWP